tara:strand:- start:25038 stop:26903 length:1866 start_codon:yes stop_codon:yes gene_type:complete
MPLTKFIFRPGIDREGTDYDNEGGWFDSNLIRFKNGSPQKIGGWVKDSLNTFLGKARSLHGWVSLAGTKYLGVGTTWKFYIKAGNDYDDVTPIRSTTSAGDVTFSATNGDATVTVTDTSHGAAVNDFVTFSGAASLGGLVTAAVLNQEYQIASVPSTNTYTIEAKDTSGDTVTANSSDSGNGGGSTVGTYQITVGLDVFVAGTGWGTGTWGASTFGSSSALSASNQLRLWTQDHFGEDLMICPRGGGVYKWTENSGTSVRATALSGISGAVDVPTIGLQVITSEKDRHLIILGADPMEDSSRSGDSDPMLIAFSDQENALDFEARSTNTAGELRLSSGSSIIGAVKARQEILIWTDTALYSMQFIGPPYTFGVNLINENTGLMAPKAAVTGPTGVFWMGYDNFYVYTGSIKKVPCSVLSYVFDDFNSSQAYKTHAFSNTQFDEVGWFYCSEDSTEIDKYVMYNYSEQVWSYGLLERHAWLDAGVEPYPRATLDAYLYEQETGYDADGSPMTNVYIESSDFDIGDGEQFSFISKIIPDIRFLSNSDGGQVNLVLKTRNFPGDNLSTNSTSVVSSSTQQNHVRARARQAVVRLESDDDNAPANTATGWRLGATRLDIRPDGRR